jgi:hypothetical protein
MPPMKPAPTSPATAPAVNPGARPVGDREGDVAGQCRHQEPEGQLSEREQHRPQVLHQPAGGQVGQRVGGRDDSAQGIGLALGGVGDLITGEQEAQRDQQAAGCDERDHVAHTGQQNLPDPGTPAEPTGGRRGTGCRGVR